MSLTFLHLRYASTGVRHYAAFMFRHYQLGVTLSVNMVLIGQGLRCHMNLILHHTHRVDVNTVLMFHNVRMVRKLALLCLCLCDIQFSYKLTRHTNRYTIAYGLLWKTFLIANGVICQQFLRVTYSLVNHWGIDDEHYHLLLRHCCLSWISRLRHCDIVHSHKLWRRFLKLVVHFPAHVKLTTSR